MVSSSPFSPEQLEVMTFEMVRKGYDPAHVKRVLGEAAAAIRSLQRERDQLLVQLADVKTTPTEPLEPHRVAEALGNEATQVLEAARAAAAERAERAEREAEAVRAEALAEAETIRAEAAQVKQDAVADAELAAEQAVEEGRQRGRDMVNEAQVVRERMLTDLARKRQTGRAQVEQLRAGRDRLLEALSVTQASLDSALKDLVDSVPEARGAAERAGLRIANEEVPSVETLEAEIEAARLVGHPLVEGVATPGAGPVDDELVEDPSFVTAEMQALTVVDDALAPEPEPETSSPPRQPASDPELDELRARLEALEGRLRGRS